MKFYQKSILILITAAILFSCSKKTNGTDPVDETPAPSKSGYNWTYLQENWDFLTYNYKDTVYLTSTSIDLDKVEDSTLYYLNSSSEYYFNNSLSFKKHIQFAGSDKSTRTKINNTLRMKGSEDIVLHNLYMYSNQKYIIDLDGRRDDHDEIGGQYDFFGDNPNVVKHIIVNNCELEGDAQTTEMAVVGGIVLDLRILKSEIHEIRNDGLYGHNFRGLEFGESSIHDINKQTLDPQNNLWYGAGDGLQIRGGSKDIYIHNSTIDRSNGMEKFCIILQGGDFGKAIVEDNNLLGPHSGKGGAGIYLGTDSEDIHIIHNEITKGVTGVYIMNPSVEIIKNTFKNYSGEEADDLNTLDGSHIIHDNVCSSDASCNNLIDSVEY